MRNSLCEIALKIPSCLDNLNIATSTAQWICKVLYKPPLSAEITYAVELSVSEACTNAIKHKGHAATSDIVSIVFIMFKDKLVIHIKDQGSGFNLNELPLPDFNSHPEGGYGIFIIKSMMDEVSYTKKDNYNVLSMTKYVK